MTPSNDESRQTAYLAAQLENLSSRAVKSGIVLYSDFLTPMQQKMAVSAAKHHGAQLMLYGGNADSQRKAAAFAKDADDLAEYYFPIAILHLTYDTRFLKNELTHRDFLGALMGLSIKREMIGDVVIGDKEAYLFVLEKSKRYVMDELHAVQRAAVSIEEVDFCPLSAAAEFEELHVTVSSMRLDCVVTQIMRTGRNTAVEAIGMKYVKVEDAVSEKPDAVVKEGQEISVRGYGKFRIGETAPTRKGRIALTIFRYK